MSAAGGSTGLCPSRPRKLPLLPSDLVGRLRTWDAGDPCSPSVHQDTDWTSDVLSCSGPRILRFSIFTGSEGCCSIQKCGLKTAAIWDPQPEPADLLDFHPYNKAKSRCRPCRSADEPPDLQRGQLMCLRPRGQGGVGSNPGLLDSFDALFSKRQGNGPAAVPETGKSATVLPRGAHCTRQRPADEC